MPRLARTQEFRVQLAATVVPALAMAVTAVRTLALQAAQMAG